jgi:hypothetical protein
LIPICIFIGICFTCKERIQVCDSNDI